MTLKPLVFIAVLGLICAISSVLFYNRSPAAQGPLSVNYNPYEKGIYATGIIESYQTNGSNVNIYPEVSGRIVGIFVKNNQFVSKGVPLFAVDDSIQKEIVQKDEANIQYAMDNLINSTKQLDKIEKSYNINYKSVSLNALDTARYTVKMAEESLNAAKAQYRSDKALLDKYLVRASIEGTILRIVPAMGDYVSPAGSYDTYTQAYLPSIQMGTTSPYLQVRVFVNEILTPRLPQPSKLEATLFVRGLNNQGVKLTFDSIQPSTIPNIELSDERTEKVDVRVLPIIFKFERPKDFQVFPGQLVDIFLKGTA